jgi:hypothetical protein
LSKIFPAIKRIIAPDYTELSLFVMSYTCVLFFVANIAWFKNLPSHFAADQGSGAIIIYIIFAAGILLSLFNAFSTRKKTSVEKIILLFFAVLLNGFAGLWAGTYYLERLHSIFLIFPIWNIFSSYMLISSLREGNGRGIDETRITDGNVKIIEVVISALIATAVFAISQYLFHNVWAVTLSLCIAYATNLNAPVVSLITCSLKNKCSPLRNT